MVKMEAELNLLREELSVRSQLSPAAAPLSYCSQKLGSNGANSNSPTPSPPSNSEDPPSLTE